MECTNFSAPVPFYPDSMYNIQQTIIQNCPQHACVKLWGDQPVLSSQCAINMTGGSYKGFLSIWNFTTYYPDNIVGHFQAWKVPMFTLLALLQRPPYGRIIEAFSLANLMGNPVDTIASLIFTLHIAQKRLRRIRAHSPSRKRAQEMTLLITAFAEVGDGIRATNLTNE